MKTVCKTALLIASLVSALADAQALRPTPLPADNARWIAPAAIPGLQFAWVVGAEDAPRPYALRVRLAAGTRIPPHTHPDERHTTVLAGTIHVGFGETFDEGRLVAISAGQMYVAPANVPHYVWAKDGETIYQEAGAGPTATVMVKR